MSNLAERVGKVLICSASLSQVHLAYHTSIVTTVVLFERLGIKWDQWHWEGDFHVERAVNGLMSRFLNSDFDQMIWIDVDEGWQAHDVVRLFAHPEEVVAGAYRMKNAWEEYTCVLKREDGQPVGKMLPDGNALLAAEKVAAGFMKVRKSALQKLAPHVPTYLWKNRQSGEIETHHAFFANEMADGQFVGMDYAFCEKLKKIGVELWVDPMPKIAHFGQKRFDGDFDKFLRDGGKKEAAFAVVRAMKQEIDERL